MTTCGTLLDSASAQLHGWGSTQDRVTSLTNPIGATDTTFIVDYTFGQSVGIAPGIVEIDREQIYVVSADPTTNTITVDPGFGRGYNGTTAASHSAGARVVSRPKFPRKNLFTTANDIIGGLFPDLFAVGTYTGTVQFPSNTYNLAPARRVTQVIDAQWQDPIGNWQRFRSYSIDPFDDTLRIPASAPIGRPLRVIYKMQPGLFASEADDFVTATGLPSSCVDVVALGIVARLVPGLDISRAQLSSVEQSDRSRVVPPSAGVNVAKYLMAEFQERLHNEAQSLRQMYPSRMVRNYQ